MFVIAITFSLVNIFLAFVMPESRNKQRKPVETPAGLEPALGADEEEAEADVRSLSPTLSSSRPILESVPCSTSFVEVRPQSPTHLGRIVSPFAVFLPQTRYSTTGKRRTDYSMTLLGGGLFAYLVSCGIYPMKFLYAEHTFGWGAEEVWLISATTSHDTKGFRIALVLHHHCHYYPHDPRAAHHALYVQCHMILP